MYISYSFLLCRAFLLSVFPSLLFPHSLAPNCVWSTLLSCFLLCVFPLTFPLFCHFPPWWSLSLSFLDLSNFCGPLFPLTLNLYISWMPLCTCLRTNLFYLFVFHTTSSSLSPNSFCGPPALFFSILKLPRHPPPFPLPFRSPPLPTISPSPIFSLQPSSSLLSPFCHGFLSEETSVAFYIF